MSSPIRRVVRLENSHYVQFQSNVFICEELFVISDCEWLWLDLMSMMSSHLRDDIIPTYFD